MQHRRLSPVFIVSALLSLIVMFAALPASAQDTTHIVQPGENLYRISLSYNVTISALAQANNISNTAQIYVGQQLIIPDLTQAVESNLFAPEPTYHVIQPGETLQTIANQYGLTVQQLAQINNIANPNLINRGQTLTVFAAPPITETLNTENPLQNVAPEIAAPSMLDATMYTVQPGETLADIAVRFGISWPAIVQANSIDNPNNVIPGQMLIIPSPASIADLGIINPSQIFDAPEATVTFGKQIIVSISKSRIYAYENGEMIRTTLVSTGLPATPTVLGNFTVERKYASQIMSGPDYYLPNVEWISYFYSGYAIHGTYWHNNFGQPMSHGCVNLTNEEAKWFYDFAPVGTPVTVIA